MEVRSKACDLSTLDICVQHDHAATVAEVTGLIGDGIRVWTASSKVMPGDKFNRDVAVNLALGRALEKAGRQLIRQGEGMVKCIEDNTAASKASKLRAAELDSALASPTVKRRRFRRNKT